MESKFLHMSVNDSNNCWISRCLQIAFNHQQIVCSALQIKNSHFIDYTCTNLNAGGAAVASNARAPQMEQHKVFLLFGRRWSSARRGQLRTQPLFQAVLSLIASNGCEIHFPLCHAEVHLRTKSRGFAASAVLRVVESHSRKFFEREWLSVFFLKYNGNTVASIIFRWLLRQGCRPLVYTCKWACDALSSLRRQFLSPDNWAARLLLRFNHQRRLIGWVHVTVSRTKQDNWFSLFIVLLNYCPWSNYIETAFCSKIFV